MQNENKEEVAGPEAVWLPDPFRLDGKVALVTGAGYEKGIGRAIGRAYAAAGAAVGFADLESAGTDAAAREVRESGGDALSLNLDVTDPKSVTDVVSELKSAFGPVDILVNNAGITRSTSLWNLGVEEFDEVMNVNLRGGFLCLKEILPDMMERGSGSIIWISSQAGRQGGGIFGSSHYAASKAGVMGLCQGAARELGPYGIRSNAIAPGLIDTGIIARASDPEFEQRLKELVSQSIPLRQVGVAEHIAYAALYLASEAAAYTTGVVFDVNGGAYFA